MKLGKIILSAIVVVTLTNCGVPQQEHDKLLSEVKVLEEKLDECSNGAEKLIAQIEKAFQEKDYSTTKEKINQLSSRHPESSKNKEFKELLSQIDEIEKEEQKKKEIEEKEEKRLANLNNTGMWRVGFYVDEFEEPTKDGYITNKQLISGTFSNTATQDSRLNVKFLISNSTNISIQLYEYAKNNPVKAYSSDSYSVLMRDSEGNRLKLRAVNYSDRLSFNKTESKKVHKALMKGGKIEFRIKEIDTPTTQYNFAITNAEYYNNAYRKLKE